MIRTFYITLLFLLFLAIPRFVAGQISIHDRTEPEPPPLEREPDKKLTHPEIDRPKYITDIMRRVERRRVRRDRNTFTTTVETKLNQSMFSNWAKGGDNTFAGSIYLKANHTYRKERLSFITDFDSRLGVNIIDSVTFKNEDYFNLKHQTAWDISKYWSLAGTANFRSQYMKGYKSKSDKTLVSDFMSPGTLDLSLGFRYKPKYWNITISPITGKMTFVLSDTLSWKGINGVEKGKHFKPMIGSTLDVTFSRKFAKDRFGYDSRLRTFWNFTLDPTAAWENTFELYTTKWLTTAFYWHMIYDKEANVPRKDEGKYLQWNSTVGLTLKLIFKSRKNV
jgi:hypothetical protein